MENRQRSIFNERRDWDISASSLVLIFSVVVIEIYYEEFIMWLQERMHREPFKRNRFNSEVNESKMFYKDMSLDLSFSVTIKQLEACSEPSRTSKMKFLMKIINGWKTLTTFAKSAILDVWLGFKYASETSDGWFDRSCTKRNEDKCNLFVYDQRFGTFWASLVIEEFEESTDLIGNWISIIAFPSVKRLPGNCWSWQGYQIFWISMNVYEIVYWISVIL